MIDWSKAISSSFKDVYGDFGGYLLTKLKAGEQISDSDCSAQLQKKGFASATKLLKDTKQTKTVVTAFHVPGKDGKIHHYDIDIYRFSRKKPSDPKNWEQQPRFSLRNEEVQALYGFLTEQNELLGIKFDERYASVVFSEEEVSASSIASAKRLLSRLSEDQIEEVLGTDAAISVVTKTLPRLRVDLLKALIKDLSGLLDQSETAVQKWLDEDPKVRCLVFGLEYVDYKRETPFGNSQFDVLTDISGTEHVIIELKSPNKPVFETKVRTLKNGTKTDYALSADLAEAIPQVIKYFREYERETSETFIKNGTEEKKVPKAIIVIGRNIKDDPVWQDHYCDLRNRIAGIEILTYDHLVEKLENQIKNLEGLDT